MAKAGKRAKRPARRESRDARDDQRDLIRDHRQHLVVHFDTAPDDGGVVAEPGTEADVLGRLLQLLDELGAEPRPLQELSSRTLRFVTVHVRHSDLTVDDLRQVVARKAKFFAERNPRLSGHAVGMTDPMLAEQWAWPRLGAPAAWKHLADAKQNVKVAIVDSGVFKRHQDLPRGIITGMTVGGVSQPFDIDEEGHGTLLAGTIAAITGNALGGAGAAGRNAAQWLSVLAVKFFDTRLFPTAVAAALAIEAAGNAGAAVINASWDVGIDPSLALKKAIRAASNSLIVISAGNDGTDNDRFPTIPAAYGFAHVMSAMASDEADAKPGFSNFGASVDIAAPGKRIASTYPYIRRPPRFRAGRFNPAYRDYDGTSASAAFVAGAAALLKHADAAWTPPEIKAHLVASAEPVPALSGLCRTGARLSLERAICGPAAITFPKGGERLVRGTSVTLACDWRYATPALQTVRIELVDATSGAARTLLAGQAPAPSYAVTLPNQAMPRAMLRVAGEQRALFAHSRLFRIA